MGTFGEFLIVRSRREVSRFCWKAKGGRPLFLGSQVCNFYETQAKCWKAFETICIDILANFLLTSPAAANYGNVQIEPASGTTWKQFPVSRERVGETLILLMTCVRHFRL